jgi:hypothetical protein
MLDVGRLMFEVNGFIGLLSKKMRLDTGCTLADKSKGTQGECPISNKEFSMTK